MLEHIQVQGFRSLRDFSLEIRKGLNVLVGPNGAGKTNIILFFEFLRSIATRPLTQAVGTAGGVAQVFAKKGKLSFEEVIHASVKGQVTQKESEFSYLFEFSFRFNKANQDVSFCRQRLTITKKGSQSESRYLVVEASSEAGTPPSQDHAQIEPSADFKRESSWVAKEFKTFSDRGYFRQNSLTSILFHTDPVVAAVCQDFAGRLVLNVVPSQVKRTEDITRRPGIDTDGSGVSSTLYAIKRKRAFYDEQIHFRDGPEPIQPSWQHVVDLIRVAVPSIEAMEVVSDPFDNQLRCQLTIGKGRGKSVVPLSSMSDGTVKWISLILRISTSRAALLLEEPENYLHPLMQREIVRLLRGTISDAGFSLVSTHSETLLNAVRADELIVVSYGKNGTKARRVSNADDVESEINETGFGLGYYYLANAVEAD